MPYSLAVRQGGILSITGMGRRVGQRSRRQSWENPNKSVASRRFRGAARAELGFRIWGFGLLWCYLYINLFIQKYLINEQRHKKLFNVKPHLKLRKLTEFALLHSWDPFSLGVVSRSTDSSLCALRRLVLAWDPVFSSSYNG